MENTIIPFHYQIHEYYKWLKICSWFIIRWVQNRNSASAITLTDGATKVQWTMKPWNRVIWTTHEREFEYFEYSNIHFGAKACRPYRTTVSAYIILSWYIGRRIIMTDEIDTFPYHNIHWMILHEYHREDRINMHHSMFVPQKRQHIYHHHRFVICVCSIESNQIMCPN